MSTVKDIDVHILTMPDDNKNWADDLKKDLDREGVTQTWIPGIKDAIGLARANAYKRSTCKYVARADPDDRIPAGTYQKCLEYLESNPDVIAVYTGQSFINESGGIVRYVFNDYDTKKHHRDIQHIHGTIVARREYALKTIEKLSLANYAEAWVYTLLLSQMGTIKGLDINGYHYRRYKGQHSRNTTPELKSEAYYLATGNKYV